MSIGAPDVHKPDIVVSNRCGGRAGLAACREEASDQDGDQAHFSVSHNVHLLRVSNRRLIAETSIESASVGPEMDDISY